MGDPLSEKASKMVMHLSSTLMLAWRALHLVDEILGSEGVDEQGLGLR
jgi:hypothetical protein